MERTLAESGVASLVRGELVYAVAGRQDESELRRLLAANATAGWISLSLAREPDAFAAATVMGPRHGAVIARDRRTGEPAGMCEWSARACYVDSEVRLLAYLGGLRVAPKYRHRLSAIKGGFEAVRLLLHRAPATRYALTAIADGNTAALRLLGANLPGLPRYEHLESFSTFALRPRRAKATTRHVERARREDLASIAVRLAKSYRDYQFAPVWSARDLADPVRCKGLRPEDFLVVRRGVGIAGCVALWDQDAFKQTVVRGYAGMLAGMRPLVNLAGPLTGLPRLPAPGTPLRQVYLSHLALADNDPELFRALIDAGLAEVRRRGFTLALTGLASRHPLAAVLKSDYRPREYRTQLYLVHWDDPGAAPNAHQVRTPSSGMPHVEIAVL